MPVHTVEKIAGHRTVTTTQRYLPSARRSPTNAWELLEPRNLLRVIEAAAKTAGVEGVGIHTLRHSAAVDWLDSGVHIKAVADLLGHYRSA